MSRMRTSGVTDAVRRVVDGSPLRTVTRTRPYRFVRRTWRRPMAASHALRVIHALEASDVHVWVAGGWGVDALVGRQTRVHDDLDLLCADRQHLDETTHDVMTRLGFRPLEAEEGGHHLPRRIVWRDRTGRTVDILPVGVEADGDDDAFTPASFSPGRIDGHQVGCLSVEVQLKLHTGYDSRREDQRDVRLLCSHFGLDLPSGYA